MGFHSICDYECVAHVQTEGTVPFFFINVLARTICNAIECYVVNFDFQEEGYGFIFQQFTAVGLQFTAREFFLFILESTNSGNCLFIWFQFTVAFILFRSVAILPRRDVQVIVSFAPPFSFTIIVALSIGKLLVGWLPECFLQFPLDHQSQLISSAKGLKISSPGCWMSLCRSLSCWTHFAESSSHQLWCSPAYTHGYWSLAWLGHALVPS